MSRHSRKAILLVFATLEGGGIRPPASYANPETLEVAVSTWSGLLADVSGEDVVAAVGAYLRSGERFWPTPGALLELVPGRRTIDDADASWGELLEAARRYGRMNPPTPVGEMTAPKVDPDSIEGRVRRLTRGEWALDQESPARDAALHAGLQAVGGWRTLCLLDERNYTAARASFRSAYRAELERRSHDAATTTAKALLGDSGSLRRLTTKEDR